MDVIYYCVLKSNVFFANYILCNERIFVIAMKRIGLAIELKKEEKILIGTQKKIN